MNLKDNYWPIPLQVIETWRKWGWSEAKIERHRRAYAKDLTNRKYRSPIKEIKTVTCEHPEREHWARGMCKKCYHRWYWYNVRKPRLNRRPAIADNGVVGRGKG